MLGDSPITRGLRIPRGSSTSLMALVNVRTPSPHARANNDGYGGVGHAGFVLERVVISDAIEKLLLSIDDLVNAPWFLPANTYSTRDRKLPGEQAHKSVARCVVRRPVPVEDCGDVVMPLPRWSSRRDE